MVRGVRLARCYGDVIEGVVCCYGDVIADFFITMLTQRGHTLVNRGVLECNFVKEESANEMCHSSVLVTTFNSDINRVLSMTHCNTRTLTRTSRRLTRDY